MRTIEHLRGEGSTPWAILSYVRPDLDEYNLHVRREALRAYIMREGLEARTLKGVWKGAEEESFLILGIGQAQANALASMLDQEAFLYWSPGPEPNGRYVRLWTTGMWERPEYLSPREYREGDNGWSETPGGERVVFA